jgi:transglutaminase-like putative cysteine protease
MAAMRRLTTHERADDRRRMAWAAAAMVFGGAPHLFSVVPWVPLVVLAIAVWRIAAAARGWPLPSLWLRVPVTLLAFAGVALSYRSVSGVEAGSALLLVMAGMKLLETRTERDRVLVVLIGYFLLFAVFLREQAIWSAAWLVTGAIGITAALTQTVRRQALLAVPTAAALAARIVVQALPVAALLFVLFPRIPGPFWAMPNAKLGGVSGLSEEVSPGDISELSLSDEVAFRVRFDGEVPPAGALYWRGPVLERFDGRAWSALRVAPRAGRAPVVARNGPEYGYQLVLEPQGQRWLLALETPLRWSAPRAALAEGLQLLSAEPFWDRISYRARSVVSGIGAMEATAQTLQSNLRLPTDRNPRALALARELRAGARNDADFVGRVLQTFREQSFAYSLSPPPLGQQPVDEFLFGTRVGFCEHYASAFAVLARAGGVPARVVVGYQGGERNPFGGYWIVRQANAHAWTEVWLDGAWRRVDPTAAVAPERIERGFDETLAGSPRVADRLWRSNFVVNRLVLSWDAMNAAWDRRVLAFGPEMQQDLLLALGFDVPRPMQLAVLAGVATLAAMLLLAVTLRHRDGRRDDAAARLYARLCRRLAPVVRPRGAAETAGHYASAIAAARPDLEPEVRAMTDLYLRLRYGGTPDPELQRRLTRMLRRFRPRSAPARAP